MMNHNLISVIIPVFNHYQDLSRALESVFAQSIGKENLEVIVVDDGSFEEEKERFKKDFLPRFPNVKFIEDWHHGAPAARNRGFTQSRGEFVIFWDADLSAKKQMLQTLLNALKSHSEASYAYSSFYFGWKKFASQEFDAEELKKKNYIHTSALIRRVDFSGFDESLEKFQDWDLWLTMLQKGKMGFFTRESLFTIKPKRGGISSWLPSFIYRFKWLPLPALKKYFYWKEIVQKKHDIFKPLNN